MTSLNDISEAIIGAAIEVHREKGPGLLESTYETCLGHELTLQQIPYARQVQVPIMYKGARIEAGFRADMIVADRVLVELKALESLLPVHKAQLLSYIRKTGHPLGLLINFHVRRLVDGVTRIINDRDSLRPLRSLS